MKVILKLLERSAHRAFPKAESEFNLLGSEDHVLRFMFPHHVKMNIKTNSFNAVVEWFSIGKHDFFLVLLSHNCDTEFETPAGAACITSVSSVYFMILLCC